MSQEKTNNVMQFKQLTDPVVEWLNQPEREYAVIIIEAAGARMLNGWISQPATGVMGAIKPSCY